MPPPSDGKPNIERPRTQKRVRNVSKVTALTEDQISYFQKVYISGERTFGLIEQPIDDPIILPETAPKQQNVKRRKTCHESVFTEAESSGCSLSLGLVASSSSNARDVTEDQSNTTGLDLFYTNKVKQERQAEVLPSSSLQQKDDVEILDDMTNGQASCSSKSADLSRIGDLDSCKIIHLDPQTYPYRSENDDPLLSGEIEKILDWMRDDDGTTLYLVKMKTVKDLIIVPREFFDFKVAHQQSLMEFYYQNLSLHCG